MYSPRNPHTPKQNETLTPQKHLEKYLAFRRWDRENPVIHLSTCTLENHFCLNGNGMCCLSYIKQQIDQKFIDLAGIRAGIWPEPVGFQIWLSFAWKRLEELEESHDYYPLWTKTLTEHEDSIYHWIEETPSNLRPGFSIKAFKKACQKYGYEPNIEELSFCFNKPVDELQSYWRE